MMWCMAFGLSYMWRMEYWSTYCSTYLALKFLTWVIVFRERCLLFENNLVIAHDEFLVVISLDLVTLNESAWLLGIMYMEDVSVLFEKDSEDISGKFGEISEDEVKLNESKAISGIRYGEYARIESLRRIQTTRKD